MNADEQARILRNFGPVNPVLRGNAALLLRVLGWRRTGSVPPNPKIVAIFAPHTSNWDFLILYLMVTAFGMKGNYFAKHTLCRPPLGWFMRATGAIPVVRRRTGNLVDSAVATLSRYDRFYLGLAPEGTRRYTGHWRTGFYHIAMRADARILLLYADYAKKETGLGPLITPSGDIDADFEIIKAFYADKIPRRPENRSEAVLGEARRPAD